MINSYQRFSSSLSRNISEHIDLTALTIGICCIAICFISSCTGSTTSGTDTTITTTDATDTTTVDSHPGKPTLTVPDGSESWNIGSTEIIKWDVGDINANIKIELLKGDKLNLVITHAHYNGGEFTWTIPNSVSSGTDYKVRITSVVTATKTDQSDNNFTIE